MMSFEQDVDARDKRGHDGCSAIHGAFQQGPPVKPGGDESGWPRLSQAQAG
jgi:hypothetical protein